MVARPLWERKAVGSNPATPTTNRPSPAVTGHVRGHLGWSRCVIAFGAVSPLPLLCKLHARVSHH